MDFIQTGGLRSPFSPRVRQSISGRRNVGVPSTKIFHGKFVQPGTSTGDVIYKTPMTTVETYGTPLPVIVTEALTFASSEVSVRLSPCGWCWAVTGRRVLAWLRDAGKDQPQGSAPTARELTLPQTDLSHKAELVVLFYDDCAQMPSCIGVSPEGVVRYWPSVAQEGVYVDVSCELGGQECSGLGERTDQGLALATTTCTVVLLEPTEIEGRATVTCHTLRPPSGWLGGIGRRVSLLFFGSMPAQADTKLVGVVTLGDGVSIALVCTAPEGIVLQLWKWQQKELHEHSLRKIIMDAFRLQQGAGDVNSAEVTALDVHADPTTSSSDLVLLLSAPTLTRSNTYWQAVISVEDPTTPRVASLTPLRWPREDSEERPRLLPLPSAALLYTTSCLAISGTGGNDKADFIDVSIEGDKILTAAVCGAGRIQGVAAGAPLLFSSKHGVLILYTTDTPQSVCDSPIGSPCPSDIYDGNLSLYEIDPYEVRAVPQDTCGNLKTAFLFHLRRDQAACSAILAEYFPPTPGIGSPSGPDRDVDSTLDRTVVRIATEILDDIPAGDPRWKQRSGPATNISLGSSASLQIAAQLRDKQRALSLFVDFLRATGLWQRLGLISRETGGGCTASQMVIASLAERLTAALALRTLQQTSDRDAQLIDATIYQVVCGEGADFEQEDEVLRAVSSGALCPSDVAYRRVSRVWSLCVALCRADVTRTADVRHAAVTATTLINIITHVLNEVHKWRAQWRNQVGTCDLDTYNPRSNINNMAGPHYWIPTDLMDALADLHHRSLTECARDCPDATIRAQVFDAAMSLADLMLTAASHLEHTAHASHYHKIRGAAIRAYMQEEQTERAAALAEKFRDYMLLVKICVTGNDLNRLYSYMEKYSREGMCEQTFAWLCDNGGANTATLIRDVGVRYPRRLTAWLRAAPHRTQLLVLHYLTLGDHSTAGRTLLELALAERESVARAQTMASLAKLCLLASDEADNQTPDMLSTIENQLQLCEQHLALPSEVKIHHGLDTEDTRVIPPEELVQMYVESEGKYLNEYDYKKALDLTYLIEDMELRDELRLKVWCACITRNDWSSCCVENIDDELQDKMFFRVMNLVNNLGGDLELLLPPLEDILTSRSLTTLAEDPRFLYVIKCGYQMIHNTRP